MNTKIIFEYGKYGKVEGIILARYKRIKYDHITIQKKFLWFKYYNHKNIEINEYLYLVFIPWKHQLKELVEIKESQIINKNITMPKEWIKIEKFKSEAYDYYPYGTMSIIIKDFMGYPWIFENKDFITNFILGNHNTNLEMIYKYTEFANEEFDEEANVFHK